MNIKTNLLEEYVNFVDNTKKRNKKLWICTIILVFILFILTIIRVFRYLMNNSFSLQQIQKTSGLDANLISRQYKLNLMADFMRNKYENPKMKQSEIANQLGMSSSTLQRYRNDINMFSPYRINPNNTK